MKDDDRFRHGDPQSVLARGIDGLGEPYGAALLHVFSPNVFQGRPREWTLSHEHRNRFDSGWIFCVEMSDKDLLIRNLPLWTYAIDSTIGHTRVVSAISAQGAPIESDFESNSSIRERPLGRSSLRSLGFSRFLSMLCLSPDGLSDCCGVDSEARSDLLEIHVGVGGPLVADIRQNGDVE